MTHSQPKNKGASGASAELTKVRDMVKSCIQCGTCTGSCPNAFAMDLTPRHMWRMVLMGLTEDVFQSKTFMLCSACYTCSLRCPRGLPLTEAMSALKQMAFRDNPPQYRQSTCFYRRFMESVRKHGRVQETTFISRYFMDMTPKHPLMPLKYTSMGLTLMRKGKISPPNPFARTGGQSLEPIFKKVEALEEAL